MAEEEKPLFERGQVSVKFTRDQAEFWNENISRITGSDEPVTKSQAIHLAAETAVSRVKIVEKTVPTEDPAQKARIEELTASLQEAQAKAADLEGINDQLRANSLEYDQLKEKYDIYMVLSDKKTSGNIKTLENFIDLLLSVCHHPKVKVLVLKPEHYQEYKAIKAAQNG